MIPKHIILAVAPETKETCNRDTNHNLRDTINNRWQGICASYHLLTKEESTNQSRKKHIPKITVQAPLIKHQLYAKTG